MLFEDCCRKVELYERFIKLKVHVVSCLRKMHLDADIQMLIYMENCLEPGLYFLCVTLLNIHDELHCQRVPPVYFENVSVKCMFDQKVLMLPVVKNCLQTNLRAENFVPENA